MLAFCFEWSRWRRIYLPLATGQGDVDETTGVLETLEGTALGDLGLLLGLNLFRKSSQSSIIPFLHSLSLSVGGSSNLRSLRLDLAYS